jgi:hypothetical protein
MLVSQGVISRNYDNSQYNGLILNWLRRRTESGTFNYLYSLSLVAFLCDLYASALFTTLGFCVIHCLRLIYYLRLLRYLFTFYISNSSFAKTHSLSPFKTLSLSLYLAFYLYSNLISRNKVLQSLIRCCLCYTSAGLSSLLIHRISNSFCCLYNWRIAIMLIIRRFFLVVPSLIKHLYNKMELV